MPELPEVEVGRRKLEPQLTGRTIRRIVTTEPSYFFLTSPGTLKRRLRGQTVRGLVRKGKYLSLEFDSGNTLLLHLGMTGQLFMSGASSLRLLQSTAHVALSPEAQPTFVTDKHTHFQMYFDDDRPHMLFRDVRKFGKVKLLGTGEIDPRIAKLGTDALKADPEALFRACKSRKTAIKNVLLDQSVLAGVGNIYADEALFAAGVRPTRRAPRVTRKECGRLIAALQRILLRSIETGGSSISDFVNPDGEDGKFQDERRVYARTGEPCCSCSETIKRLVIGQRSSHFCPHCQS